MLLEPLASSLCATELHESTQQESMASFKGSTQASYLWDYAFLWPQQNHKNHKNRKKTGAHERREEASEERGGKRKEEEGERKIERGGKREAPTTNYSSPSTWSQASAHENKGFARLILGLL